MFICFEPDPERPVYVWLPVDDVGRSITVPATLTTNSDIDHPDAGAGADAVGDRRVG